MAKNLFLLRHGPTGAGGRYIGATDLPLAPEAVTVVAETARALGRKTIDRIVCSPMQRCRQTADLLGLSGEIEIWPELREVDFGLWEGKNFAEILPDYGPEIAEWVSWSPDFAFPGGERIGDFLGRVELVRRRIDAFADGNFLVISHGGFIRQLLCAYLGLPPDKYLLFEVHAGRYSSLSLHSEGGVLTSFNSGC